LYGEWKEIEFPPKVLYINLETTRLRGRPRNRWQDEVREDGRLVGGKVWKERVYRVSQEEWTKLRESVPYVKIYRYNPKHLCPKLNGYGDKG